MDTFLLRYVFLPCFVNFMYIFKGSSVLVLDIINKQKYAEPKGMNWNGLPSCDMPTDRHFCSDSTYNNWNKLKETRIAYLHLSGKLINRHFCRNCTGNNWNKLE